MREILFRGKRVDNGKWVEGNFAYPCNIIWEEWGFDAVFKRDGMVFFDEKVIPETVGQYTGLTDKNGTKIFEGDIVKNRKIFGSRIGIVIFSNGEFMIKGSTPNYIECTNYNFWQVANTIEVIGNIHDNPKLMEDKL